MKQQKQSFINYIVRSMFVFVMLGICFWNKGILIQAEEAPKAGVVAIECINYETGELQIKMNDNIKVYYSDATMKTWNVIEGAAKNGIITMDISWISSTKNYVLNLKGSEEETVVSVELPKSNTAVKATIDKIDGSVDFTNDEGATQFQWRKAAATDWWTTSDMDQKKDKTDNGVFEKTIEEMRVRGGKIQVRLPQIVGESEAKPGSRPSKIITLSVPKRGNAPSVKVVANSMNTNTTDKMEYKIISVAGTKKTGSTWEDCDKKMSIYDMTPQVITTSGGAVGQEVVVAIRKSETEKVAYSKNCYLVIPAQEHAPALSEFTTSRTSRKYSLIVGNASKDMPYQYAVVGVGAKVDEKQLSWKAISNSKAIFFDKKKYPEGSIIYVRKKGENASNKTELRLPSAYTTLSISYLTE